MRAYRKGIFSRGIVYFTRKGGRIFRGSKYQGYLQILRQAIQCRLEQCGNEKRSIKLEYSLASLGIIHDSMRWSLHGYSAVTGDDLASFPGDGTADRSASRVTCGHFDETVIVFRPTGYLACRDCMAGMVDLDAYEYYNHVTCLSCVLPDLVLQFPERLIFYKPLCALCLY